MIAIQFPSPDFRFRTFEGREQMWDSIRKKWIVITPEEWVRQNMLAYLVKEMRYPAALIAVEKQVWIGQLAQRFDIAVYDNTGLPWLLMECKSPEVPLSESVWLQGIRYNQQLKAPYLAISNGNFTACAALQDSSNWKLLSSFPSFK